MSQASTIPTNSSGSDRLSTDASTASTQQSSWHVLRRRIGIAILIVVAGVLTWESGLKYRFTAKRWGVVEPGRIYRSGQISKWMIDETLVKHNIQVIVDLTGLEKADEHQLAEIDAAERHLVDHHRCPLGGDGTGDLRHYAKAIATLDAAVHENRPVLVHCSAGAQRTGGVVAAYRVLVQKESPQKAYSELPQYGWRAEKDGILLTFLNSNMAELAGLLVKNGVLNSVPDPLPVVGP